MIFLISLSPKEREDHATTTCLQELTKILYDYIYGYFLRNDATIIRYKTPFTAQLVNPF